jgi:hypothetical protein
MEVYVISKERLASVIQWQAAIIHEGLGLILPPGLSMTKLDGMIPCQIRGVKTGFECQYLSVAEFQDEIPASGVMSIDSKILAFRWGGDPYAAVSSYMAAAAYARAAKGAVFDGEDGKFLSADRAIEIAYEIERRIPLMLGAVDEVLNKIRDET